MTTNHDWRLRHLRSRSAPTTPAEKTIVVLLDSLTVSISCYLERGGRFPDGNGSRAYGEIIQGIELLANERLDGLDGGLIYEELEVIAGRVGYSIEDGDVADG